MPLTVIRTGECNQCGACCADVGKNTEEMTGLKQVVPDFCVYYRRGADDKGVCSVYGTDKMFPYCMPYPPDPGVHLFHPQCSYQFVTVREVDQ